jgi:alkylation response protein AidB-like acyl-CoA dehydrogenase
MSFDDTPEQAAFRSHVRNWFAENMTADMPVARAGKLEDDDQWFERMREWARRLHEAGLAGLVWPKEYGGAGLSAAQQLIFGEEASRAGAPFHVDIVGLGIAGPTLMFHGTEEQKLRYLPTILDGSEIWCQLWSEPDAGSDLAAVRTKAVRDGDDWKVNGQKVWTTIGHRCRWGLLLARTDPNVPKHAGLTAFIVDMRSAGITIRPLRGMDGDREFSEIFLDDVIVPDGNRVGEPGEGWKVTTTSLMLERFAVGGVSMNYTEDYNTVADLVKQFGADRDPVVRDRMASLYVDTLILGLMLKRFVTAIDADRPGPEGSILKLKAAEFNVALNEIAMEVLGSDALRGDTDAAPRFLRSRATTIEGGTSEIQRNILGERVLGLPREPKPTPS